MFGRPDIKLLEKTEIPPVKWCKEAMIVYVKNGKGALTHVREPDVNHYSDFASRLILNGKPLVQSRLPFCCTCEGLLAAGCGLENVNCAELDAIRRNFNDNYTDVRSSSEILKPLLELLEDGYYILADVIHYPSDGSGKFFYSIPNKLTHIKGYSDDYYLNALYTAVPTHPAFLIPTQSAALINRERVDYYKEKLLQSPDSVRGIAFYEYGFFSALLDGHHKAYAAAELGLPIRCLTIIPGLFYRTQSDNPKLSRTGVYFCDINIEENSEIKVPFDLRRKSHYEDITPFVSTVAGLHSDISCRNYPTAEEIAIETELLDRVTDFELNTDEWLKSSDCDDLELLKYSLVYLLKKDPPEARKLALKIIKSNNRVLPTREAWKTLTHFRDSETEQLFVDFLVNESKDHYAYDIVNSYWD